MHTVLDKVDLLVGAVGIVLIFSVDVVTETLLLHFKNLYLTVLYHICSTKNSIDLRCESSSMTSGIHKSLQETAVNVSRMASLSNQIQ